MVRGSAPYDSGFGSSRSRPPFGCGFLSLIVIVVIVALISVGLASTIPNSTALNAAKAFGLANSRVVSENVWFPEIAGCHDDDLKEVTVTGTNVRGDQVTLKVCVTLWGSTYVRF